jgi:hypothetical protein
MSKKQPIHTSCISIWLFSHFNQSSTLLFLLFSFFLKTAAVGYPFHKRPNARHLRLASFSGYCQKYPRAYKSALGKLKCVLLRWTLVTGSTPPLQLIGRSRKRMAWRPFACVCVLFVLEGVGAWIWEEICEIWIRGIFVGCFEVAVYELGFGIPRVVGFWDLK